MRNFEGSAQLSKKEGDTSINVSLGRKGLLQKYAEAWDKVRERMKNLCVGCNRVVDKPFAVCSEPDRTFKFAHKYSQVKYGYEINVLCKDCSKKCKQCGKFYCLGHIRNHKCVQK